MYFDKVEVQSTCIQYIKMYCSNSNFLERVFLKEKVFTCSKLDVIRNLITVEFVFGGGGGLFGD